MELLEFVRSNALAVPKLAKFAIAMAIIVGIPALSRRTRLPSAVVLLFSGVLVGPHGLALFGGKAPIADFLADLGKLLLMFFAGLEIDLEQFRKAQNRSMLFGVITTASL
jgi:Kef-type K+ transport system membrane component KefB